MTIHHTVQLFIKSGKKMTRRIVVETTDEQVADAEYQRRRMMYVGDKTVSVIRTKTQQPI